MSFILNPTPSDENADSKVHGFVGFMPFPLISSRCGSSHRSPFSFNLVCTMSLLHRVNNTFLNDFFPQHTFTEHAFNCSVVSVGQNPFFPLLFVYFCLFVCFPPR